MPKDTLEVILISL